MSNAVEKNILFIGTYFGPERGTVVISEQLAKKLSAKQWRCKLASHQKNKFFRLFHQVGVLIFSKAKIVHIDVFSGNAFKWALITGTLASILGKKIVLNLHGGKLPEFYETYSHSVDKLFKKAATIVSPSKFITTFFVEKGFKVTHMPNALSMASFKYVDKIGVCENIIWVRAFSVIYAPELAIEALALVNNKYPRIKLTMVGPDHGIRDNMVKIARSLNVYDNITFKQPIANHLLSKELMHACIFINTTHYESFGMAVLEAAATGIPVVSTPAGEIPLIWDHEADILITKDWSPTSMATNIIRLIEDESLRENLRRNARIKAEHFAWENIIDKWEHLLNNLL